MKKKVVYDASILVNGSISGNIHRTGLYRFTYEVLRHLIQHEEIEIWLFDFYLRERELAKWIQKEFPQCKMVRIHSRWYLKLIFPVGDLADNLRTIQTGKKRGIKYIGSAITKSTLLFIERCARWLDRTLFVKRNIAVSVSECDVYYTTYFKIPEQIPENSGLKKVFTIHDMIPILHPEFFATSYNRIILREVVESIAPGDFVVAVSESTKKDFLEYRKDFPPERVIVSHLAASIVFFREDDQEKLRRIREKYNIGTGNYILSVCTLEPRKNLKLLVDVFVSISKQKNSPGLKLVLIGSYGWNNEELLSEISEFNILYSNSIIITGFVSDTDLASLYSDAYVFVYPSLHEGFGLPVLEAMQCGVPVISSNTSSLPEVVGESGILFNPLKEEELEAALNSILNDSNLHREKEEASIKRAKEFTWVKTVKEIELLLLA